MSAYSQYRFASAGAAHTHAYLEEPLLELLAQVPRGARVLDAGCGNGATTARLAEVGYRASGVDLSESGIAQAQKAHPDLSFRVASVYDPFETDANDALRAVVALEVIEHLYDPRRFLGNVHAALPPGGILVLSTPYHGYAKNLALALTGKLDAHFTALWDGGHIKFFSRRTLEAVLVESGFRVTGFRGAGRVPYLWKSMVVRAERI